MAKIMPAMQLAVHAESGTFYGSPYGVKSNFFRLYGLLLFCITMGLAAGAAGSTIKTMVNDTFQGNDPLLQTPLLA